MQTMLVEVLLHSRDWSSSRRILTPWGLGRPRYLAGDHCAGLAPLQKLLVGRARNKLDKVVRKLEETTVLDLPYIVIVGIPVNPSPPKRDSSSEGVWTGALPTMTPLSLGAIMDVRGVT